MILLQMFKAMPQTLRKSDTIHDYFPILNCVFLLICLSSDKKGLNPCFSSCNVNVGICDLRAHVWYWLCIYTKCGHFDLNVFTSSFLIRSAFLAAHIPLFLYPFLHTVSKTRPFEYLRLTSLGVIGNLYPSLRCFIFWLRAISTKLCLYLSHKAVSLCLLQVPWWKQMNKKW